MSGFTVTVERELLEGADDVHGTRPLQIWQPPIELTRGFYGRDGEQFEAWEASTSASAYADTLGTSPGDALRQFAREAAHVFGETGTAPDVQWVASVDAPAYEDGMARTMPAALTSLAKTFDRVYGDRNDDREVERESTHYCEDCELELALLYDDREDEETQIVCGHCGGTNTREIHSE